MSLVETQSNRSLFYRVASFALFFLVAAAAFNGYYDKAGFADYAKVTPARDSPLTLHGRFTLESSLDGTADRPYVFRRLVPWIANSVNKIVPAHLVDKLYNAKNNDGVYLHDKFSKSDVERDRNYFLRYWVVFGLEVLSYFLTALTCYRFCLIAGFSKPSSLLSAVVFMLTIPYFMENGGGIYDCPEMLFFFLSALLAIQGRWLWLIPLSLVATINKESYLFFLPVLYPLLRQRFLRNQILYRLGLIAIPSVLVNLYVHWAYRLNPGGNVEEHFLQQVLDVKDMILMSHPHITYGILQPRTENIFSVVFLLWAIRTAWPWISKPYRQHFWIAFGINLPLFLILGGIAEIRALSMLYVSFVILLATLFERWVRDAARARVPSAQTETEHCLVS